MRGGRRVCGRACGLAAIAVVTVLAGCGDDEDEGVAASAPPATASPATTTTVPEPEPIGIATGPLLDPEHLDLPAEGLAVQVGETSSVVLVSLDGHVLGHLDGFALRPSPWHNPPLRGAGPLVLGRGEEAFVLDGDRLEAVAGGPGAVPLAGDAVLEPSLLRLGDGTEIPFGEGGPTASSDRSWVTVREPNADRNGYGRTTAYWVADGTPVELDDGCLAASDTGRVPVVLCDLEVRIDDVVVHEAGPFERPDGRWTAAQLSDDRDELLLQHSGECESQTAWRMSMDGDHTLRPLLDGAWDASGLGWLPDGRVVASFGPGVCGTVLPDGPGVYVLDGNGGAQQLLAVPADILGWGAKLWREPAS